MAGPFYVYSEADLNIPLAINDSSTTSALLAPDVLNVSDDDLILDDIASAAAGTTPLDTNQTLASGLVLDGVSVGDANDLVYASGGFITIETAAGQLIDLYPIITVDPLTNIPTPAGFVATAPLAPSTGYTLTSFSPDGAVAYSDLAPCFTADTLIECAHGPVPVQDIQEGDMVVTRDHGLQAVRWVGRQAVAGMGEMAPVRFKAGVLGNRADLVVSPMHRMLISGPRAELLFGHTEMLAHAVDLCDGDRIFRAPVAEVTYFHLLFDRHEILNTYGCWSESFAPSAAALNTVEAATRAEILKLFPQLDGTWQDALPTLSAAEAAMAL